MRSRTADGQVTALIRITPDLLRAVRPDLPQSIATLLAPKLHDACEKAGITRNFRRVAHFLAQIGHESGFRPQEENLWYTANRIVQVWPNRFSGVQDAQSCAMNPEALANRVYGGRMGNTQKGDGYRFRGRGLLQITGRANYRTYGDLIGQPLTDQPDLALQYGVGSQIAVAYWAQRGLNRLADLDDLTGITRAINGGLNGLQDRSRLYDRAIRALA